MKQAHHIPFKIVAGRDYGAGIATTPPLAAPELALCGGFDPIYAAIERHKQTAAIWDAAVNDDDETEGFQEAVDDAREPLMQAGVDLVTTAPTTPAGIVTAISYIRTQMRNNSTYMPYETKFEFEFDPGYPGDGEEVLGWIDAWLDTLAGAIAALDKEVQS
jgi:hypothetical protein